MKLERHKSIIEIINSEDIETQEELAKRLNELGYAVTQATVSRDIRELKLSKVATPGGRQKYALMKREVGHEMNAKYMGVLRSGLISCDVAMNILVVKTVSGMAMAVATAIDAFGWHEIVGCIAGDDTIMCAIRTSEDAVRVMGKLNRIAKEQQGE